MTLSWSLILQLRSQFGCHRHAQLCSVFQENFSMAFQIIFYCQKDRLLLGMFL